MEVLNSSSNYRQKLQVQTVCFFGVFGDISIACFVFVVLVIDKKEKVGMIFGN